MSGVDHSEITALVGAMTGAPARVQAGARRVASDNADRTVDLARASVDVRTGTLRGSISSDVDGDGLGYVAGPTAGYGGYHEDGTSDTAAEPYMGPAFDAAVPAVEGDLADVGADAVFGDGR